MVGIGAIEIGGDASHEIQTTLFEGIVNGEIIREKRGTAGFGYDPIFRPEGYTKTFAELGLDVKNQISHRARAVRQLAEYLKKKKDTTIAC